MIENGTLSLTNAILGNTILFLSVSFGGLFDALSEIKEVIAIISQIVITIGEIYLIYLAIKTKDSNLYEKIRGLTKNKGK